MHSKDFLGLRSRQLRNKSGFKRCNGVGRGGLEDQLRWVLNDDVGYTCLGAKLLCCPTKIVRFQSRDLKRPHSNQLNAVGKMSHVPITDGEIITWALRPVAVVMTLITPAALKSKQPNMNFLA